MDKEAALAEVLKDPDALKELDPAWRADRDVVQVAVSFYGAALEHADEALRSEKDIVMAAVKDFGWALRFADEALRNDKEVVLTAVANEPGGGSGATLGYASVALRSDREVVMSAIRSDAFALRFADPALRADKEVVMEAVGSNGRALVYADGGLRANKEVVLVAVAENAQALEHVDERLRSDPDVLAAALHPFVMAFNVTALSGKSCCCVLEMGDGPYDLLRKCAEYLSLDTETVIERGELLLSETGANLRDVTELDPFWQSTISGAVNYLRIHELQLVVRAAV